MKLAIVLLAASLAGCGMFSRKQEIVEVKVPVAVSCVPATPERPSLITDAELRAMTDFQIPIALFRDRAIRQGYEAILEAIVRGCATLPSRPEPKP